MTNGAEKYLSFLAEKLAEVAISHAPETRGKDYGYSVNLYFPEREFWSLLKVVDILSELSEEGKKIREKARREVPDSTRREVRESILRRRESERTKRSRKGKGRGK